MHIIGTAGHVDHGKSALIAALTGTNPDRLIEEQRRGMTLDLGFALLRFDDGIEGGIVDVPGHERFLHNMLAGAAGMELLLLVVDANEGVMPQTLEHLQILQFLNVLSVIVVASKMDLVEAPARESVLERIRGQLAGTIAQDAPVVEVSALTGENLDALKSAIHDALAALPSANREAPVYLPIDRVFTLPGLGTVVTGTLMQGSIASGETLVLEPGGRAAHVRSIGVFGSAQTRVESGSRVALSLPGIERAEVARGQAIVGREYTAQRSFAVHFTALPEAMPLLRRRTPVRAYVGSAEILGTLVLDDPLQPADGGARLHLLEPVVAFPGLRFVLRRPTPMMLLGGGYVEGVDRSALAVVRDAGLEPIELGAIASAANLRESAAREMLDRLVEEGEVIRVARPPAYVERAAADSLLERVLGELREAHRREPWAMGATSVALSRALGVAEPALVRVAEEFVARGALANRGGYYATTDHAPAFAGQQRAFFDHLVPIDSAHPLLPISFAAAATAVKLSALEGVAKAFDTMLAQGAFVKVGDNLYTGAQIAQIVAGVEAHFDARDRMSAAEFRDLLRTSRKYAMPMLEWLDARGVTVRNGDYRTLRKKPALTRS
ncbi:MAG TPA: selenocysteine-specific translation elongation factor [Candidatus Nitrosotalea sp.]|nr:selenocysteine-specific translation elongation factor [Candidatus Nitrosotalea sp.]